jgi:hypothetical protein
MDILSASPTTYHSPRKIEQFSSMMPGGTEILWKLQNNPEILSDEELTRTSLSSLSRGLGAFTSRRIINAYLRWLEVQRKAPKRNINYHWFNTIAHWTQALRSRGFSLEEISREVSAWKEVNGPFLDTASLFDSESRLPPTSVNLTLGWDRAPITTKAFPNNEETHDVALDKMSRRYETQLERKPDSALANVPASYICNRCKGRGENYLLTLTRTYPLTVLQATTSVTVLQTKIQHMISQQASIMSASSARNEERTTFCFVLRIQIRTQSIDVARIELSRPFMAVLSVMI